MHCIRLKRKIRKKCINFHRNWVKITKIWWSTFDKMHICIEMRYLIIQRTIFITTTTTKYFFLSFRWNLIKNIMNSYHLQFQETLFRPIKCLRNINYVPWGCESKNFYFTLFSRYFTKWKKKNRLFFFVESISLSLFHSALYIVQRSFYFLDIVQRTTHCLHSTNLSPKVVSSLIKIIFFFVSLVYMSMNSFYRSDRIGVEHHNP